MFDLFNPSLTPYRRFPTVAVLLGFSVSLLYLPTLWIPFDFSEDGCLVYPDVYLVDWSNLPQRVLSHTWREYSFTGPFRPVTWTHFMLSSLVHQNNSFGFRLERLLWCGFSGCCFLLLLREFRVSLLAGLIVTLFAFASPYRAEIWLHHGMPEAFGTPYAYLALWCAIRAARSSSPLHWDIATFGFLLLVFGVKNTYFALVPAILWARFFRTDRSIADNVRSLPSIFYFYLLIGSLPVIHFLSLKLWPTEHHFSTGFSLINGWNRLRCYRDALHPMILAFPILLALYLVWRYHMAQVALYVHALVFCFLLLLSGMLVYLPWPQMHPRYTLPGVWGIDLEVAILLTLALRTPGWSRLLLLLFLILGIGKVSRDNLREQFVLNQRLQPLWQALTTLEQQADSATSIGLISSPPAGFHPGEIVHFTNHLHFRNHLSASVTEVGPSHPASVTWLLSRSDQPPTADYSLVSTFGIPSRHGSLVFLWRLSGSLK